MFSKLKTADQSKSSKHSALLAVFSPVFLTLVSVVIFLRLGWVISVSTKLEVFSIITISVTLSLLTALSISSISSNMKIGSGGLYHILSRTFGIELSSATCLPLFVAQSFTIAFYIMGFSETIKLCFPHINIPFLPISLLVILTVISTLFEKMTLKIQAVIFIIVSAALVSFFMGKSLSLENTESFQIPKIPFWTLFAIFFPTVTGIEGGLSFSRRLKNPSKSIPRGILSAILLAYLVYLSIAYVLTIKAPQTTLYENSLVMSALSALPTFFLLAICVSTLSGALSMLIAAPKMLKALSSDGVLPKLFSKEFGKGSVCYAATLLSFIVALSGITIGKMNSLAPIITMFFLISYCMINLATALEAMVANPSWRPTFRVSYSVSFFGALLCIIVMFMINPGVTLLSFLFVFTLYLIMKKRHISTRWDDFRHSLLLFLARFAIYKLNFLKANPKTWRPNLLVFVGDPLLRPHLISLTSALTHNKGFLTMASIVDAHADVSHETLEAKKLSLYLNKLSIPALIKTYRANSLLDGVSALVEHFGIGPITPNTIALGATQKRDKFPAFAKAIQTAYRNKKNILIIKESKNSLEVILDERIDIWWSGGTKNNPELMLAFALMLQRSKSFQKCKICLKMVAFDENSVSSAEKKLLSITEKARFNLDAKVYTQEKDKDVFQETISKSSKDSSLVLIGLRPPMQNESIDSYSAYYESLVEKTKDLPSTLFVLNGEDLPFYKIFH